MKPGEATTRLFDLHTSTDQAANYQCTGRLETVQELKISCLVNLLVLGLTITSLYVPFSYSEGVKLQ
jgi:hypothetical protein